MDTGPHFWQKETGQPEGRPVSLLDKLQVTVVM
ncbi:hypothetical protein LVISKB_1816 [Levilactobacillus brevis KB290]|uniref:Uncharacterized protein n=1 Tax=Levilactobacillus brevis KB290 TaxID=1001583 RepID=M5B1A0_LEVBR|nr:hypothetical protein LVISKB_1816 [Levilactobacillus brevis KB290]